jgi:hypothetical protein
LTIPGTARRRKRRQAMPGSKDHYISREEKERFFEMR